MKVQVAFPLLLGCTLILLLEAPGVFRGLARDLEGPYAAPSAESVVETVPVFFVRDQAPGARATDATLSRSDSTGTDAGSRRVSSRTPSEPVATEPAGWPPAGGEPHVFGTIPALTVATLPD